jgi:hypothetical protein
LQGIEPGAYGLFRTRRWAQRIFVEVHPDRRVRRPRGRTAIQARGNAKPYSRAKPISAIQASHVFHHRMEVYATRVMTGIAFLHPEAVSRT